MTKLFDPSFNAPAVDYERMPMAPRQRKTWWQQQKKEPLLVVFMLVAAVGTYWLLGAVSAHGQARVTHPAVCGSEGLTLKDYNMTFIWKQPSGCGRPKDE